MAWTVEAVMWERLAELVPVLRSLLEAKGCALHAHLVDRAPEEAQLRSWMERADAYVAGLERLSEQVIEAARRLRVISVFGAGTDNVDVPAATRRGVAVCYAPGANAPSVAELAVGLMVCLARDVVRVSTLMGRGTWPHLLGTELQGRTVSIIGFGAIGREVAKRCRAFGMEVVAFDVYRDERAAQQLGARFARSLEEALAEGDFVSLHIPLMPSTRGLLGRAQLEAMKPTAFLINLSRGGVVDEEALIERLRCGRIRGAALDVFEGEPHIRAGLRELPNVVLTPHIGGSTREALTRIAELTADNIASVLTGSRPRYIVNPEVLAAR